MNNTSRISGQSSEYYDRPSASLENFVPIFEESVGISVLGVVFRQNSSF